MRYLIIGLLLSGCATQPSGDIYTAARNECLSYGMTPGTDNYANCVQREVQHRREIGMRMIFGR